MIFIKILFLLFFFYTFTVYSQSDKPKSTNDSLSYSDTVRSEVAPVCLNIIEVRSMIVFPNVDAEGRVVVKCLIDEDGNVIKTGELTGPDVFYDEIRRVALFLKFTPGLVNSNPVKVWVSVPFMFKLK